MTDAHDTTPSRDSLMRQFRKAHRDWPTFLSDSGPAAEKAWMDLSAEDREAAVNRLSDYVAALKEGRHKVCSFGVYLRERRWEKLPKPGTAAHGAGPARIAVAPFGPVWAGMRALALLAGAVSIDMPLDLEGRISATYSVLAGVSEVRAMAYLHGKGIGLGPEGDLIFPDDFEHTEWRRRVLSEGFPEVNRLHHNASQRSRDSADARYAALADLCEAVPVGSEMFERWRAHDEAKGWPFVPAPGTMRVVYFPKGGPEGLQEFKQAAQAAMTKERSDEHAA